MRICIIEDNEALASGIAHRLRDRGHAVDTLHSGDKGASFLAHEGADIVILDINLPGVSGLEILRQMRARDDLTPVLLLTARAETADRVAGLDAGADDYLVKPFEMDELEARVRALGRRRGQTEAKIQSIGSLDFDTVARVVQVDGEVLELSRRELATFECLLERRGRLAAKSVLADQIYGVGADIDEKAVEVAVSRLRKKLAPHGIRIKSARGLGYVMEQDK